MTIKEAWDLWRKDPQNYTLAGKSRPYFASVILDNYGNMDLSEVNLENAQTMMAAKIWPHEFYVKAASILHKLLSWGFEHSLCKSPQFEWDAIIPEMPKPERLSDEMPDIEHPENVVFAPICKIDPNTLNGGETIDVGTKNATKPKAKTKRTGGRPSTPICKIDPDTLKVVDYFESQKAACESVGTDISKAIIRGYKSSGFYWCKKSNAKAFIRILEAKKLNAEAKKPEVRQQHLAKIKEERETAVANARQQFEEEVVNTVANVLAKATDEELLTEIRRRGWHGSITIHKQVEI